MSQMYDEFPKGLCVDCGMSVPGGEIICDICKSAWQTYSYTAGGDVRRERHTALQPGVQELYVQDGMQLVPPTQANDAQIRDGEKGRDA
jgi:hypothetical protein